MLGFWIGMFAVAVIAVMVVEDIRDIRKARRKAYWEAPREARHD